MLVDDLGSRALAFFGSPPLRAWEFALGGMVALVPAQAIGRWRISPVALPISGLLTVRACGGLSLLLADLWLRGFENPIRFNLAGAAVRWRRSAWV